MTLMVAIVVVEDDAQIRAALLRSLSARGYDVRGSADGLAGLSLIVDGRPDAVLLDLGLPDIDGLDLLRMIRAVSTVPVVVITAQDDDDQIVRTLDAGADDYIVKPFSANQVEAIDVGKSEIEQDRIGPAVHDDGQACQPVRRSAGVVPPGRQRAHERGPDLGVVLDHHDGHHQRHRRPIHPPTGGQAAGPATRLARRA